MKEKCYYHDKLSNFHRKYELTFPESKVCLQICMSVKYECRKSQKNQNLTFSLDLNRFFSNQYFQEYQLLRFSLNLVFLLCLIGSTTFI